MVCENCQAAEASVHLTQVTEDGVRKRHLCSRCAEQSGLDFQDPASIADALLLGLGKGAEQEAETGTACPRCGLKRSDFKRTGRLGCTHCYTAFRTELHPLIRAIHRADRHTGKAPATGANPARGVGPCRSNGRARERMQADLESAVAREAFEEAARIRDRIRRMDTRTGGTETPST